MRLAGKVALVTGAAQGIGLAIAGRMMAEGADVIALDLPGADWSALHDRAGMHARTLVVIEGDVAEQGDWDRASQTARDRFGGIDILVNNAGISGPSAPARDYPLDAFDTVMRVNCRGVLLGMQHAVSLMHGRQGSIVNISSVSGLGGGRYLIAYNASKHAVIGLTKVGAVEFAEFGIRVNAVCPAMTETPMMLAPEKTRTPEQAAAFRRQFTDRIPLGRYADPDEIAAVVCFLASAESSFVNGAALPVDGGLKAQ